MSNAQKERALQYHRGKRAGKLAVTATKPLANQRDLAQAYSPGVAFPCMEIDENPEQAYEYTAKGNLVAVVTNGSAVLGLGNIGPLASKPVMEGKVVLFKKFAGIDAFDIEVAQQETEKIVEVVASLEPTFGAINLEDIKAPECFEVERQLRERMQIPVFHDDQHGTAIVACAAIKNSLEITGKSLDSIKLVSTGGGAACLACLDLLVSMGLPRDNITLVDLAGVVYQGRIEDMNPYKACYARETSDRTLGDAICDADVFLGLSAGGVLKPEMVEKMASQPVILAMANPNPEIMPDEAKAVRPDAILATGRSDFPNQVNNVLCFPFIFRGALDCGASEINEAMKIACVEAIAALARREVSDSIVSAYEEGSLQFGADYIIPKPFDPRLIEDISLAVVKAAMLSGVARRPITDMEQYRRKLRSFSHRTLLFMQPIIEVAKRGCERLVYAEGENPVVLQAVQAVIDEGIAQPILVGRPEVIQSRIEKQGLRMEIGRDLRVVDPNSDPDYKKYYTFYHSLVYRRGISLDAAKTIMRTNNTVIAACLLACGEADAMICGAEGRFDRQLSHIIEVVGKQETIDQISSMTVLILPDGPIFITDTHIGIDPDVNGLVNAIQASAQRILDFGIEPKVALLSHSNFGTSKAPSAIKMQKVLNYVKQQNPHLQIDGEMHASAALNPEIRRRLNPYSSFEGRANLLVMPNLDTANITMEMIRATNDVLMIGPILSGVAKPAHVVTPSSSSKSIFNMSALAVADACRNTLLKKPVG